MMRAPNEKRLIPALGWISAAIVVAGAHVALGLAFAARAPEGVPGDAAPAIMIDLQPIAVPPEPTPPPPPEMTPEPPQAQPDTPPPPPVAEEPAKEPPPEATPPLEAPPAVAPTPEPPPDPMPEIKPPEVPVKAEAVLPPPPAAPPKHVRPPKPVEQRPKPKREAVHREPKRPERSTSPQVAPPAATPQPSAAAVASARAAWQRAMQSHIARFKRSASASGRATVTFTISRDGQVLSARLASSSGKADLDADAVAMVERASPMPAPPAELPGRTITLTIPINYR